MRALNVDDVTQTLAEYERLAIKSGAKVQIDPPEFSGGDGAWSPLWLADLPPVAARATVHRDDVPTTVYRRWDESIPVEESWRLLWVAKPMTLFGAHTLRAALSRAFRDVIGDRREPDDNHEAPATVPRDWEAEIAATSAPDAVDALHAEMKRASAVTPHLEQALRARRAELTAAARAEAPLTPAPELSPTERIRHDAFFPPRPQPQDHLPATNRAARRAKGRRR